MDVKTGEVRVVAQFGRQPDMRNDGRIVFNGEGGGHEDLHTVEPDGSNLTQIGAHPEDSYPSWSDGAAVAFHSQLAGPQDRIFVQWNTQVARSQCIWKWTAARTCGRSPAASRFGWAGGSPTGLR